MAKSASELALVGPDITCQLEPNSAAMMQGMMAVYSPYSGGMPAKVAKAMPCGSTSTAPKRPAMRSARKVWRVTKPTQLPKSRSSQGDVAAALMGRQGVCARAGPEV